MQPYPQDPNQGGYPRFDQPQPGVQPGFAVQHNNPYAQPVPGQAYIPPTQYGDPQAFPAVPQQDNLVTEMEVRQIDQHLSSGCYSCYNVLLYLIVIGGFFAIFAGVSSMFAWIPFVFTALEGACAVAYAFTMLDALKNKRVEKAELGVKLSLATAVLLLGSYFAQYTWIVRQLGSQYATSVLYGIVPSYIVLFFVYINPAMKIKGHLERREAVLQKGSNPYNV